MQAYHKDKVPPEASMACGAAAALVATAVTFPLEVVRRRAMGGQVRAALCDLHWLDLYNE